MQEYYRPRLKTVDKNCVKKENKKGNKTTFVCFLSNKTSYHSPNK